MIVDDALVDKLATLSKLEFSPEKKEIVKQEFQKMLNFIEKLNEVNTDNVQPLVHMSQGHNRFRPDIAENTISHEAALANAPQKDSDYFKVPKVLNK